MDTYLVFGLLGWALIVNFWTFRVDYLIFGLLGWALIQFFELLGLILI